MFSHYGGSFSVGIIYNRMKFNVIFGAQTENFQFWPPHTFAHNLFDVCTNMKFSHLRLKLSTDGIVGIWWFCACAYTVHTCTHSHMPIYLYAVTFDQFGNCFWFVIDVGIHYGLHKFLFTLHENSWKYTPTTVHTCNSVCNSGNGKKMPGIINIRCRSLAINPLIMLQVAICSLIEVFYNYIQIHITIFFPSRLMMWLNDELQKVCFEIIFWWFVFYAFFPHFHLAIYFFF